MELSYIILALVLLTILLNSLSASSVLTLWSKKRFPPSPGWALPLIGHLHLLGKDPHKSLQLLSRKFGPIMFLKLGLVPSIIVSSPKIAREALKENGLAFASRPYMLISEIIGYNFSGIGIHYSEHSKRLRKMCVVELLTPQRLESSRFVRLEELSRSFHVLLESSKSGAALNVREMLSTFTFNVFTSILMSKKYFGRGIDHSEEAQEFKQVIDDAFSLAIKFHISEFAPAYSRPLLELFDPTVPQFKQLHAKQDKILQKVIEEHKEPDSSRPKDFMDVLLEAFKDEGAEGEKITKAFITDLTLASDSTAVAAEWGMAQLLHNPHVLKKARDELDSVVGPNRLVQESDFANLPYFQAVIKETLRLCPPGPLLIPRSSDEPCTIGGYYVPKGSTMFINAYAMGRDPSLWEKPTEFMPERFLHENSIDVKGQHFELIPFGSGRRMCPGMPLALKTLELLLPNLVHGFEWSFPAGSVQTLEDCFETVLLLKSPLEVTSTPRHLTNVYDI